MSTQYIISPKTKKKITVGGGAWDTLMKSSRWRDEARNAHVFYGLPPGAKSKAKHRGRVTKTGSVRYPKTKPIPYSRALKSLPASRRAKRRALQSAMRHKGEGRGGRTRGWAAEAPQRGRERHALKKKCGSSCFLKPETEGFPICPALRVTGGKCRTSCKGIISAKVRAGQWKYEDVKEAAEELERKYGCLK